MQFTVEDLAQRVSGRFVGDGHRLLSNAAPVDDAGPNDLTFIQEDRHISRLEASQAGAVLISPHLAERLAVNLQRSWIIVNDPQVALWQVLPLFRPALTPLERDISPQACIHPTANIGPDVYIGPFAVIGEGTTLGAGCEIHAGVSIGRFCRVGRDTVLHAHAVLYDGIQVGSRVIIHAHAVVGADGFGYRFERGRFQKIMQLGTAIIEDDVEIGAGATIDRGALGDTVIGSGTKIDNQVQIAHGCHVGRHNVFASQVGMAGSARTGDYVRVAGQVGIRDHITVNQGCTIGAKAGVTCDIPAGESWLGAPATPEQEQKKILLSLKKVPEMRHQLRALEQQVQALQQQLASTSTPKAA